MHPSKELSSMIYSSFDSLWITLSLHSRNCSFIGDMQIYDTLSFKLVLK